MVQVSDRLHLKPLLRAVTVPQTGFVLALSENSARLVEFFADMAPEEIRIADLPKDAADYARKASINDRSHSRRIHGSGGRRCACANAHDPRSRRRDPAGPGRERRGT
ncbi:MAG: hypothetical protein U1E17_07865 [Geminicoccaceae bacterium]